MKLQFWRLRQGGKINSHPPKNHAKGVAKGVVTARLLGWIPAQERRRNDGAGEVLRQPEEPKVRRFALYSLRHNDIGRTCQKAWFPW